MIEVGNALLLMPINIKGKLNFGCFVYGIQMKIDQTKTTYQNTYH